MNLWEIQPAVKAALVAHPSLAGVPVLLDDGAFARAAVPSGASTGAFEAVELRDGGERYAGKGVQKAVSAVLGPIADAITGLEADDQRLIDQTMLHSD